MTTPQERSRFAPDALWSNFSEHENSGAAVPKGVSTDDPANASRISDAERRTYEEQLANQ
jgi:hypothetical protein